MVGIIVYASDWVRQEHLGAYLDAFGFEAKVKPYNGTRPKDIGQNTFLIRGSSPVLKQIIKGLTGQWIWGYEIK